MAKHIVHHFLKARIQGGEIMHPLTRAEALELLKKWAGVIRHGKRGHRTVFLMQEHHGVVYDRLVIETRHHQMRRALAAEDSREWVTA